MIRDLSESLRSMLTDATVLKPDFPELAKAIVSFDRPAETFTPAQTAVGLFLFSIQENLELRANEPVVTRQGGLVRSARPAPRINCSYLVTAWPVGEAEPILYEHRLLAQVLEVVLRNPTIPAVYLKGSLAGAEPPIPLLASGPEPGRHVAEFWSAIGSKLRASLLITATLAVPLPSRKGIAEAVTHGLNIAGESTFEIGGRVLRDDGTHLVGAVVRLDERATEVATDEDGRFRFAGLAAGNFTLIVTPRAGAATTHTLTVPAPPTTNYDIKLV